jgi:oligoribonuclease NrnB/cAMP/cGMP phosphodiesterase (DHH superfamily)
VTTPAKDKRKKKVGKDDAPAKVTTKSDSEGELEVPDEVKEGKDEVKKGADKIEEKPEPKVELDADSDSEIEAEDDIDKKFEFDFIPGAETLTVITHLDADGVLSIAAINKMISAPQKSDAEAEKIERMRVFFTSPPKIFSALAKSVPDLNKVEGEDFKIGQLYICDLSLHRDTLLGSSLYDKVKWFDHHEVNPEEQYDSDIDNVELLLDPTGNSTTSIICDYFKLDKELGEIADEIDINEVKSDNAKRIRDIISAMRHKYTGSKLKKMLYDFSLEISNDINVINQESFNPMIEEYNTWLKEFKSFVSENIQDYEINGHKIGIIESESAAPVYSILEDLKTHTKGPFDVLAVMIHNYYRLGRDKNNKYKNKRYTKVEFRTHTKQELIELAKILGGGGHKYASGATIHDGLDKDDLIKTIESYFTTPPEEPKKDE